jgi:hypothetical protein
VIQADDIGPVQRPVRVVEAEQHAGVDVVGAAHPLAQRERRLVDQLADDAAQHQARCVDDPLNVLAQRGEEHLRALGPGL